MTLLPRSLAARTAVVLIIGFALVQGLGLTIHALDRIELQRLAEARSLGGRVSALYRSLMAVPAENWAGSVRDLDPGPGLLVSLETQPNRDELKPALPDLQEMVRTYLRFGPVPIPLRPHDIGVRGGDANGRLLIYLHLPDDRWLVTRAEWPEPRPWHSRHFLVAFLAMTALASLLILWAVRRLTAPVRLLAEAAERLGRDVNAPALPEDGPTEVAAAASAFNTMAGRIRRFVSDRTFLLSAIGHDLRTPITRLKLRAEWMEDEEQRRKMLADLDELEAMVSATLAFGRDVAGSEPPVPMDLAALLRTILDEATDARPSCADRIVFNGPEQLRVQGRPVALKRAFANLVQNALSYGEGVQLSLAPIQNGTVSVRIEDDGPGIPADQLERVFEPFHRVESSRNRETGGTGLGLPITRNILRAHGGDVALANRAEGGVRATVTLPSG